MGKNDLKIEMESTLKSMDTEEPIDLAFYRPIGYRLALFCARFGITPNMVTVTSIFIGVIGGSLFYFDTLIYDLLAMLLIVFANSLDSTDGQLARMTRRFSRIGRFLDGVAGDCWFAAIYIAMCMRLIHFGGWSFSIFLLAAIAGFFHAKQAAMADYYRNIHLLMIKGKNGSELDESAELDAKCKQLSWKGNFFEKLTLWTYANYTKGQERTSPTWQNLHHRLNEMYGDRWPDWFRKQFREQSKPLMKYTNILSFNTRILVLFVSVFLHIGWFYFIFEITVLNVLLVYMVVRHERICAAFVEKLNMVESGIPNLPLK